MELTGAQKQALYEQGFVKLPGIVPRGRVDLALRAIHVSFGTQGIRPDCLPIFNARSYCPEVRMTPPITDLFYHTPLLSLAESLIGSGKIRPVRGGQIALRFPSMDLPGAPPPHLDGLQTPINGLPPGVIRTFTALIGVFLNDLPTAHTGNFTVYPGTHRLYEQYFQKHGPQSLLNGIPPVDLPEPQQITGQAGDAVLCHYQLGHGVAVNFSPHIRYAVFFRLRHINHRKVLLECMTDIWREWEGIQAFKTSVLAAGSSSWKQLPC